MRRVLGFFGGLVPAMLGGAFFVMTFLVVIDPGGNPIGGLIAGAISGVAVVGLIRLFRVAPWGYPVAGLISGPVPFLVLTQGENASGEDRFGIWLLGAVFGLLVGLLEWARVRRRDGSG